MTFHRLKDFVFYQGQNLNLPIRCLPSKALVTPRAYLHIKAFGRYVQGWKERYFMPRMLLAIAVVLFVLPTMFL